MQERLFKNFESYVTQQSQNAEEEGEEEGEKEKTHDFSVYQDLKVKHGKVGGAIFYSLLSRVFEVETKLLEKHMPEFIDKLIKTKHLKGRDFNEGISKVIQNMPELVLDCPQIHEYLWLFIMQPLMKSSMLTLNNIKWVDNDPKPVDDDDIVFDAADPLFKLTALILVN